MLLKVFDPPLDHVALLWPNLEPLIRKALEEGNSGYRPIDILYSVLEGKQKLWIAYDGKSIEAVIVTELLPVAKTCLVFLCGGRNIRNWIGPAEETITAYAKHKGCAHLEQRGREGWLRLIPGARKAGVILRKEI